MKKYSIGYLTITLFIGVLIMIVPSLVTGRFFYDETKVMGALLVSEFIMRTVSIIIGLLVIYDTIKKFQK